MRREQRFFNKETEITKRNQKGIMELKDTITKTENSLEAFNSTFEEAQERIRELEDWSVEIIKYDEQKEPEEEDKGEGGERRKKNEQRLRDQSDTTKGTKQWKSQKKKRKKRAERIFEKAMAKTSPN